MKKAEKKGFSVYDISLNDNWADSINQKFDVVFAGEIIEHIFDTDNFLKNIKKVLNKGGKLVITTPNIASLGRRIFLLLGRSPLIEVTARKNDAGHIRYFTQDSLKRLLEENGYLIHSVDSTVINFSNSRSFYSEIAARFFPKLGNNIIIMAEANKD